MARYFGIPFATTGDKISVPDATQPDGSVSYAQGFGYDYERPNTDPGYKPVPREGMNGLFHDITQAIGTIQKQGFPDYDEEAKPYQKYAAVRSNNKVWLSVVSNNNNAPGPVGWVDLGEFASIDPASIVYRIGDQSIVGVKEFNESPLFPTPAAGDNSNKGAPTAFVMREIADKATKYMLVRDERPQGNGPGSATAGMNTRVLNAVAANTISGASLSGNQITLPPGTYRIVAEAPSLGSGLHRALLHNVTDNATAVHGTSINGTAAGAAEGATTVSVVRGRITLATQKIFELRHWVNEAGAWGSPVNNSGIEVYTMVEIIKES